MVLANSHRVSPAPRYSGSQPHSNLYMYGTFTLYGQVFQTCSISDLNNSVGPTTPCNRSYRVWAIPRSLATTCGITIVFSSSGYLDVSVLRVVVLRRHVFNMAGFPIRTSTDQRLFAPPRSFSQLITSFVVSESLGIPHTPLFASYSFAVPRRFLNRGALNSILFSFLYFFFNMSMNLLAS